MGNICHVDPYRILHTFVHNITNDSGHWKCTHMRILYACISFHIHMICKKKLLSLLLLLLLVYHVFLLVYKGFRTKYGHVSSSMQLRPNHLGLKLRIAFPKIPACLSVVYFCYSSLSSFARRLIKT